VRWDANVRMCFFCTQALYCFVYGLGWPLANRVFREGFPFLNIVELRAKAHFLKVNIARKSFTHC